MMPLQTHSNPYYNSPDSTMVAESYTAKHLSFRNSRFYKKLHGFGSKIKSFARLLKHKKSDIDIRLSYIDSFEIESCIDEFSTERTIFSDVLDLGFPTSEIEVGFNNDSNLIWSSEMHNTDNVFVQKYKEIEEIEDKESIERFPVVIGSKITLNLPYDLSKYTESELDDPRMDNLKDLDELDIHLTDTESEKDEEEEEKNPFEYELIIKSSRKKKMINKIEQKKSVATRPKIYPNFNTFSTMIKTSRQLEKVKVERSTLGAYLETVKTLPNYFISLPSIWSPKIDSTSNLQLDLQPQGQTQTQTQMNQIITTTQTITRAQSAQKETHKQNSKVVSQLEHITFDNQKSLIQLQLNEANEDNTQKAKSTSNDDQQTTMQEETCGSKHVKPNECFDSSPSILKSNFAKEYCADYSSDLPSPSMKDQVNSTSHETAVFEALRPSTISSTPTSQSISSFANESTTPINRSPQIPSCTSIATSLRSFFIRDKLWSKSTSEESKKISVEVDNGNAPFSSIKEKSERKLQRPSTKGVLCSTHTGADKEEEEEISVEVENGNAPSSSIKEKSERKLQRPSTKGVLCSTHTGAGKEEKIERKLQRPSTKGVLCSTHTGAGKEEEEEISVEVENGNAPSSSIKEKSERKLQRPSTKGVLCSTHTGAGEEEKKEEDKEENEEKEEEEEGIVVQAKNSNAPPSFIREFKLKRPSTNGSLCLTHNGINGDVEEKEENKLVQVKNSNKQSTYIKEFRLQRPSTKEVLCSTHSEIYGDETQKKILASVENSKASSCSSKEIRLQKLAAKGILCSTHRGVSEEDDDQRNKKNAAQVQTAKSSPCLAIEMESCKLFKKNSAYSTHAELNEIAIKEEREEDSIVPITFGPTKVKEETASIKSPQCTQASSKAATTLSTVYREDKQLSSFKNYEEKDSKKIEVKSYQSINQGSNRKTKGRTIDNNSSPDNIHPELKKEVNSNDNGQSLIANEERGKFEKDNKKQNKENETLKSLGTWREQYFQQSQGGFRDKILPRKHEVKFFVVPVHGVCNRVSNLVISPMAVECEYDPSNTFESIQQNELPPLHRNPISFWKGLPDPILKQPKTKFPFDHTTTLNVATNYMSNLWKQNCKSWTKIASLINENGGESYTESDLEKLNKLDGHYMIPRTLATE